MELVIVPEVLLVNKPLEWTSFDVTNKLKRMLIHRLRRQYPDQETKKVKVKVGHAGTLDPLATGLLIVCVGKKPKTLIPTWAYQKNIQVQSILGQPDPVSTRKRK